MATNKEIDEKLRTVAFAVANQANLRIAEIEHVEDYSNAKTAVELELIGMHLMTTNYLLGELAKRLPEPKE